MSDKKIQYDLSMLTIDDFSEGFKDIVEGIGIEAAYKLCELYGGLSIYIPKVDYLTKRLRLLSIQEDYKKGVSFVEIAKKYNMSLNHIRVLCLHTPIKSASIEDYLDKD